MNSNAKTSEIFRFFSEEDSSSSTHSLDHSRDVIGGDKILNISTYLIVPNRSQPRSVFNGNNIIRLADSIKRYGMLQPLTVRRYDSNADSDYYELVAGERRLRAAKLLGMRTVPCVLIDVDDSRSAELAIIENLLREDLNMFEQAEGFKKLIENHRLTQEEVALRVSMSQSAIANKLRLLRLTQSERELILESNLTERHARALLKLSDTSTRSSALKQIILQRMNVCAAEEYIDKLIENERISRENYTEIFKILESRNTNIHKINAFCSILEKNIKNMREKGCLVSSVREEFDDATVLTIKISKKSDDSTKIDL